MNDKPAFFAACWPSMLFMSCWIWVVKSGRPSIYTPNSPMRPTLAPTEPKSAGPVSDCMNDTEGPGIPVGVPIPWDIPSQNSKPCSRLTSTL